MKKLIYIFTMVFIAAGANAQIDRSQQPKPGPAPKVKLEKPKTFELKNGLKVMVVENHKLPRVNINLSIDNPLFTEGSKKGIDDLTGFLLGNGTSKISKDDYQEEVDFMGASIYFNSKGAYANALSRYFPRVIEMMAQGIIDPNFTQEDFDKETARTIDGLKAGEKSVQENAMRVENVLVYGANHPKGEFVTEEKIKSLNLNDVKNHFKNYFVPNHAYLTIVGDVKFNDVKKMVEKEFAGWKKGNIPTSNFPAPKDVSKTEINFVDMPNAVQSEIAILNVSNLKMTDKDYYPALVANQIYGGDFNSYLNMALREKHGWTYGARSSVNADKHVGKARGGASVRNEVTDSAVVVAMAELNRIRTTKPDAETLATVKAGMIGRFVMNAEKPETVAGFALRTQTQNLPDNFYENYIQNINAVTPEQVQAAAQKYFSYDNARILVVGKASEVLAALEKLPYKINYFDRFGKPTTKPEQKTVDSNVTVKTVLDNYIAAIGGDKVRAVKTSIAVYEAEAQGMKLNLKEINTSDGKTKQEMSMMGQVMSKKVFDGNTGYEMGQGQRKDLDAEEIAEMKYDALPFPEVALADNKNLKLIGIESFEGKDAYVIEKGDTKSYYDINTGLKLGAVSNVEAQGQTFSQTITFEDYKEFDGVKVPQKITLDVGMKLEFNLQDIQFNQPVSDDEFQ
ncbi:MAG: pitrilysin family protein [Weeksellaceae bacterium]